MYEVKEPFWQFNHLRHHGTLDPVSSARWIKRAENFVCAHAGVANTPGGALLATRPLPLADDRERAGPAPYCTWESPLMRVRVRGYKVRRCRTSLSRARWRWRARCL